VSSSSSAVDSMDDETAIYEQRAFLSGMLVTTATAIPSTTATAAEL